MRFDDAVSAGWRLVTDDQVAVDGTLAQWFARIGGPSSPSTENPG